MVALAVGVAVVVDGGDSGSGRGGGGGGGVGGEGGGKGGREGGGQGGREGGGRVLIFDLLLISLHFSQTLYYSYYLLLVSQPHPLRRYFLVLTTSTRSKSTTSFVSMCFFSSRD